MVIGGSGRTVFISGFSPLKAARYPGYRHLNTPTKIGQPEILADLIIQKTVFYAVCNVTMFLSTDNYKRLLLSAR